VDDFTGQREDLHVSKIITAIKRFLRSRDVHGIIIAHPRTPHEKVTDESGRKDYPVPKLYDISGGAIWRNKAEYGLVVHRYPTDDHMRLQIQKIKQKSLGQIGELIFYYERKSGRFRTELQPDFSLPRPESEPPL
jgi:twinkle protein